jgi:hypothetical protein
MQFIEINLGESACTFYCNKENIFMSEITKKSTIGRIQSNLRKLVDKVENSISSNDNSEENIASI